MTSRDAGSMHVHETARNSAGGKKRSGSLYSPWPSLVTQPPKTHMKRGSGNIVYNEQSQTLECGTTNQIAPFAINAQSTQFIMKIIFTKSHSNVPCGGARVRKHARRALWRFKVGRRHLVSLAITSP